MQKRRKRKRKKIKTDENFYPHKKFWEVSTFGARNPSKGCLE